MPRVARTVQTCKWNAELDATLSNLSNVRSDRVPPWLQLLHTPMQSMAMHRAGRCVCLWPGGPLCRPGHAACGDAAQPQLVFDCRDRQQMADGRHACMTER